MLPALASTESTVCASNQKMIIISELFKMHINSEVCTVNILSYPGQLCILYLYWHVFLNIITPPFYLSHTLLFGFLEQLALHLSFHKNSAAEVSPRDLFGGFYFPPVSVIWESGIGTSLPNKWTQCLRVLLIFLFICLVKEGSHLCLCLVFSMMEILLLDMSHFMI